MWGCMHTCHPLWFCSVGKSSTMELAGLGKGAMCRLTMTCITLVLKPGGSNGAFLHA